MKAACTAITSNLPDGTKMMPDDDPPSLTHIADKTSREWIFAWLKDPKAYSTTATMPNFGLSDDAARDISAYLISQSTPLSALYKAEPDARPKPILPLEPRSTGNRSARRAMRFKTQPEIWWAVISVPN